MTPSFETRDPDWLAAGAAQGRILSRVVPLPLETVSPSRALGRALAEDVRARATLPPWDNSAMDGYAVRGADVEGAREEQPVRLTVVGRAAPGDPSARTVGPGEAIRIMTGAPVPDGADSVVRVEHTDREEQEPGTVAVLSDGDAGRNVRPAGEDARAGDTVLESGTTVGAGQIAVLVAAGRDRVPVRRRPRVAVISTGDELVGIDRFDEVQAGRAIPDTNGPTLAAAIREAGAEPASVAIARDRPESVRESLEAARAADVVVTTGGASMGEGDILKDVLEDMGFDLDFWRVRIRPGSPMSFGHLPAAETGSGRATPVFGLPGNPASSFVTFQLFVRPFLLAMAGHARVHRPVLPARTVEQLRSREHLTHFFRVRLEEGDGSLRARLAGPQGSGLVRTLGAADGLAMVPEGVTEVGAGEPVRVILLGVGPGASRLRSELAGRAAGTRTDEP